MILQVNFYYDITGAGKDRMIKETEVKKIW